MTENIDFEERLKQVAENADIQEIANLVVNLLSEQATQVQTNVLQAVLINTILEILVDAGIVSYESFQEQFQAKLKQADEDLTKVFSEAHAEAESRSKNDLEEPQVEEDISEQKENSND